MRPEVWRQIIFMSLWNWFIVGVCVLFFVPLCNPGAYEYTWSNSAAAGLLYHHKDHLTE
jgi:hypothetical protein